MLNSNGQLEQVDNWLIPKSDVRTAVALVLLTIFFYLTKLLNFTSQSLLTFVGRCDYIMKWSFTLSTVKTTKAAWALIHGCGTRLAFSSCVILCIHYIGISILENEGRNYLHSEIFVKALTWRKARQSILILCMAVLCQEYSLDKRCSSVVKVFAVSHFQPQDW